MIAAAQAAQHPAISSRACRIAEAKVSGAASFRRGKQRVAIARAILKPRIPVPTRRLQPSIRGRKIDPGRARPHRARHTRSSLRTACLPSWTRTESGGSRPHHRARQSPRLLEAAGPTRRCGRCSSRKRSKGRRPRRSCPAFARRSLAGNHPTRGRLMRAILGTVAPLAMAASAMGEGDLAHDREAQPAAGAAAGTR